MTAIMKRRKANNGKNKAWYGEGERQGDMAGVEDMGVARARMQTWQKHGGDKTWRQDDNSNNNNNGNGEQTKGKIMVKNMA